MPLRSLTARLLLLLLLLPPHAATATAAAAAAAATATTLRARAWQRPRGAAVPFPEDAVPAIAAKPPTAIAFTGGGVRAMVAAFGQLQALHRLGLLPRVKYISGISGGSWATHAFAFYQRGRAPGVAASDDEFLCGDPVPPANLTRGRLDVVSATCARAIATSLFQQADDDDDQTKTEGTVADLAIWGLWTSTLKKCGVPLGGSFTLDNATLADILRRNPSLSRDAFVLPSGSPAEHPFPVIGTALLGPYRLEPFTAGARAQQWRMLEITPLYVGQPHTSEQVTYVPLLPWAAGPRTARVGGLVEPFAFGGAAAPAVGLAPNASEGLLDVPAVRFPFSLANATLASSWAEGAAVSLVPLVDAAGALTAPYWSPASSADAAPPVSEPFVLADGGVFENVHVIGMLQRRVRRLVVFLNSNQPLHARAKWDPAVDPPRSDVVDDDFPWFFGVPVVAADPSEKFEDTFGFDYSANQVFPAAAFVPLAQRMQALQAKGKPIVVTTPLTTVANPLWGIEAGFEVNVTWCYLSRIGEWEEKLPADVRAWVRPEPDGTPVADFGDEIGDGPFAKFPNYETGVLPFAKDKANVLAELTAFAVLAEAEQFRQALS